MTPFGAASACQFDGLYHIEDIRPVPNHSRIALKAGMRLFSSTAVVETVNEYTEDLCVKLTFSVQEPNP